MRAAEVPGRCAPMAATAQRLTRTGQGGSSAVRATSDSARPPPTSRMPSRLRKAGKSNAPGFLKPRGRESLRSSATR